MSASVSRDHTTKSFKTEKRDKVRHSGKSHLTARGSDPRKAGGGSKGAWGKGGQIYQDSPLDPHDPDYESPYEDDGDNEENIVYSEYIPPTEEEIENEWGPYRKRFASSLADFQKFKDGIKGAVREYLRHQVEKDFLRDILALDTSVFSQEIPYILLKIAVDKNDAERKLILNILLSLSSAPTATGSSGSTSSLPLLTPNHFSTSIKKLYRQLDDLLIDSPNARTILFSLSSFLVSMHLLEKSILDDCEETTNKLSDLALVNNTKKKYEDAIVEYFNSEEMEDLSKTILDIGTPFLHSVFVYRLIRLSLDRNNREKELSASFLSYSIEKRSLKMEEISNGFTLLLERVEDIALDVIDVLRQLSLFTARAIIDEILPPAFLLRVDLNTKDMGALVLQRASELLKKDDHIEFLYHCWAEPITIPAKKNNNDAAGKNTENNNEGKETKAAVDEKAVADK